MNGLANLSLNKKNNKVVKLIFGAVLVFLIFLLLNFFGNNIKNFFNFISFPFEKVFWAAGGRSSRFFSSVLNSGNLAKDNEKLKQENQSLLAEVSALKDIACQNDAERNASVSCGQDNFNLVSANVMGFQALSDVILIDKGSDSGISKDMPVINQQKVLFGKVAKVFKNYSEVLLISNKDSVINIKVQQNDNSENIINGAVKGRGALGIYLDMVPIGEKLDNGDVLMTSALEGIFPKDLLVGKITKVKTDDQKPFLQAELEPFFNIKNTETLFVITNYKQ